MGISFSVDKSPDLDSVDLSYPTLRHLQPALRLDELRFFERVRVNERHNERGALPWQDATQLAPAIVACAIDSKTWEHFPDDTREAWKNLGTRIATLIEEAALRGRRLIVNF